jgi:hypothetical protein
MAWLLEHKESQPGKVALRQPVDFPVVYNGAIAGSARLPVGTTLQVVSVTADGLTASYSGGTGRVPINATDLLERVLVIMANPPAPSATPVQSGMTLTSAASPTLATPLDDTADLTTNGQAAAKGAFVHPGLLHNEEDFTRMSTHIGREPWKSGWERLVANRHAQLNYRPRPVENVIRGSVHGARQDYASCFNDAAAAYACALRWRISGEKAYADKSIAILNGWASTLKKITGSTDADLAAGIYGYEFANAGEIMRTYRGWKAEDFARFQQMMLTVFYPINHDFLIRHNNTKIDHYWANWDLCNMASVMAIGVLCDKRDIYGEAIRYAKYGKGNGAIPNAIYYIHPGGLGQWNESGRDQAHTIMGIGLMGAICEMAWKQGDDLYGYDDNRFLKGCEYVAKYNLGEDVPYKTYVSSLATQTAVSSWGRGGARPVWELVYNHYVKLKGLPAPYTTRIAEKVRPEGGGGDYGPNSGGYDQLGYGTLTFTLEPAEQQQAAMAFP